MKKSFTCVSSAVLMMMAAAGAYSAGAGDENLQLPEDVLPQLRPLLGQALQQSPKTLERNLDLLMSEAEGYFARASSLPSAGGYVNYQKQKEKQVGIDSTGTGDRFYYNASINQGVWHWGALEAARSISRIDREMAKSNYSEAYRALAAEIRAAYLGLILQKMAVRNNEHSFRLAQENLVRQQARYDANQVTYGEIMIQQLRVDEASLALRRAKSEMRFTLGSFRSLCGEIELSEADIPDAIGDVTPAPVVVPVVVTSDVDRSAAVQNAEQEVEKAKLSRVGPRYALFPKLNAVVGISRDETNRDFLEQGEVKPRRYQIDTMYAGVQVNWTIFDGFSSKGTRLAALTRLRRAEQRLAGLRLSVARNFERDRDSVMFTWDAYQVAKMRLRMARELLAHQRQEASRGQTSQEQIDTAESNSFVSQYQAQLALAVHLNAVVQYLSSKGADPIAHSAVQQR